MTTENRTIQQDTESDIAAWTVGSGIVLMQACALFPGLLPCLLLLLPLALPIIAIGVVAGLIALPIALVRLAVRAVRRPALSPAAATGPGWSARPRSDDRLGRGGSSGSHFRGPAAE
jgi:hypothetical protein